VIRDEMEQTRANLANKLGALENQVRETVSGATEAVSSTVEGVKEVVETVSETMESVTETFNVSKQVEQNPWLAFGAAVATGFVVAQVLGRSSHPTPAPAPVPPRPPEPQNLPRLDTVRTQPAQAARHEEPKQESGLLHSLESMLPDVSGVMHTMTSTLGGLAVGSLMGVIRDLAANGLPQEWKGEVTRLVDQVTTQLGGKTLDSTKSAHILSALGLGGESNGGHDQARQTQGVQQSQGGQAREEKRQEGTPYDPAKQTGEQQAGYGPRGNRGARSQATSQSR